MWAQTATGWRGVTLSLPGQRVWWQTVQSRREWTRSPLRELLCFQQSYSPRWNTLYRGRCLGNRSVISPEKFAINMPTRTAPLSAVQQRPLLSSIWMWRAVSFSCSVSVLECAPRLTCGPLQLCVVFLPFYCCLSAPLTTFKQINASREKKQSRKNSNETKETVACFYKKINLQSSSDLHILYCNVLFKILVRKKLSASKLNYGN